MNNVIITLRTNEEIILSWILLILTSSARYPNSLLN